MENMFKDALQSFNKVFKVYGIITLGDTNNEDGTLENSH